MLGLDSVSHSAPIFKLPDDLVYEIFNYLNAEQLILLEQTNQTLRRFIRSSRALWLNAVKHLGGRLPLPLPISYSKETATLQQLQSTVQKAIRLDSLWNLNNPTPLQKPRFLQLQPPPSPRRFDPPAEQEKIAMLRILPGGKQVLTTTYNARVLCWDLRGGELLGEWHHGGAKIESLDVDVVNDHSGRPAIALAVSVEHRYLYHEEIVATFRLHVLRVDIHNIPAAPFVTFKHLSETCWRQPLYIVSLEGDFAAGYSCDIGQQPLGSFMVLIMNWKTRMATRVEIDDINTWFFNWPTLQVLGDKVLLHEERGLIPNTCLIDIPEKLFPIYLNTAAPISPMSIAYSAVGGEGEISYQTRFSKKWRGDLQAPENRLLSLLSVSDSTDERGGRCIQLRTISNMIRPSKTAASEENDGTTQPVQHVWSQSHSSLLSNSDGLMFTFCLGRYGCRPFWIERTGSLPAQLVCLTSANQSPRPIHLPPELNLDDCRFIDWDDSEGVMCALTRQGAWVVEFV